MSGGGAHHVERAAGAVLHRRAGAVTHVAMVHRPRYDDWSLPKGKPRRSETAAMTAAREAIEETGRRPAVQARLGSVSYDGARGLKLVEFFAAADLGTALAPAGSARDAEVDEVRWLSVADAQSLASYPSDVEVLDRFSHLGPVEATVALVRHAKAGKRDSWSGPDDDRPLSSRGRRQAQALSIHLSAFAPSRIISAPPVRCRQTVGPLSDATGHPVEVASWAGDDAFFDDEAASFDHVRPLMKRNGCTVVCSQGGAIPGWLELLCGPTADYATTKGGAWMLSFVEGDLRAVDWHSAP